MTPANKVRLTERITAAFTEQNITHEKIEKILKASGISDSSGFPIDAPWEVHLDTRLMNADDDVLVNLARDHGVGVTDLLDAKLIESKYLIDYSSGNYNNFVLRADLPNIGILQIGYYIIENPIIPTELNSRIVYSTLRINPFCTPVENLNLDITARWMGGLYSTREEAMFAINEDFKKGIEDFSREGREQ